MAKAQKSASAGERAYAFILHKRARKKLPEFESMEEIALVPYLDVMMNLVIFMLVTIASFLPMGILAITPPQKVSEEEAAANPPPPSIKFTVAISIDGTIKAGPAAEPPKDIAKTANGDYDYEALGKMAAELKEKHKEERSVNLAADRMVRYEVIIKAMDALRYRDGKYLFDDVIFVPKVE
jgi:biopolymer transport protein TolR